jgi:hypothetical protein
LILDKIYDKMEYREERWIEFMSRHIEIEKEPTKCNLCGGEVEYIKNSKIYGKSYGSGWCYHCKDCGAYVGTHKDRVAEAMGILANSEMRDMRSKCHKLFDEQWKNESASKKRHNKRWSSYRRLAEALDIDLDSCHFGYFDMEMMNKAYEIMKEWKV